MKPLDLIARDAGRLQDVLRPLAKPGEPYALVDFPDYANVGDSAIWLGERRLLERLYGYAPAYSCTTENFDAEELRAAVGSGVVFLHGGGNFGDIYDRHQLFREKIVSQFAATRVVQLPQSIGYRNPDNIERTARIFRGHRDLHLLVRDRRSFDLAEAEFGCRTYLAPDAAFAIGPIERGRSERGSVLFLLRRDVEKSARDDGPFHAFPGFRGVDWEPTPPGYRERQRKFAAARALLTGRWTRQRRRYVLYNRLAGDRFRRGVQLLSSAEAVVTDRLHAHIISVLLGIPHVALDNDYGKIRAYMTEWTAGLETVRSASSAEEALSEVRGLVS